MDSESDLDEFSKDERDKLVSESIRFTYDFK